MSSISNIYTINSLEELKSFAFMIKEKYWKENYKMFYFFGDMGVGKTQLIKYLINNFSITSPTFNILNIYNYKNNIQYLHFDLYRKESITLEKMREIGLEILYENKENKCFIEWADKITSKLEEGIFFYIKKNNEQRIIKLEVK